MNSKAFLVLENGKIFEGFSFGTVGEVTGEIVFTTGMTGYLETLTDKSYFGQIILHTFPLIGNYGVIPEDFESNVISARGYIVKQVCSKPSNFRSNGDIDSFLRERNIVGLWGIDTRELTKVLREQGTMNGMITTDPEKADLDKIRSYSIKNAVESVSVKEKKVLNPHGRYTIALLDFGFKENIARELIKRNCKVILLPHDTPADMVIDQRIEGIVLSNGPGDPADNPLIINNLKHLVNSGIPIFGICLGHQLLALSQGFSTRKLKYGHRGANQPVKDFDTGRLYITSQNHGYYVTSESIDKSIAQPWFININDNTCEGLQYINYPVFSVQFHPEGCGGPRDTDFLFDMFLEKVEEYAFR
ncbi:MAG TPA: carbamoyl phosphate synthase small subunit [Clostridiaceae bacterium]|nr:carbamoyl phosphate synthase small subunit [Clostridiaceae bacterium]